MEWGILSRRPFADTTPNTHQNNIQSKNKTNIQQFPPLVTRPFSSILVYLESELHNQTPGSNYFHDCLSKINDRVAAVNMLFVQSNAE